MRREVDLFDDLAKKQKQIPLAYRIRPADFDGFFGQEQIVGDGKILRDLIEKDKITSIIFWGPPGSGKTTLARIVANKTNSYFEEFSATISGVNDLREVIKKARDRLSLEGKKTIVFIDEIHRFNKAQQDAFLPHVEAGTIILIGATTENPSFEVISPLLSRVQVFKLNALDENQIMAILKRALKDRERGLGNYKLKISDDVLKHIAKSTNGDARAALNVLELAVISGKKIDKKIIQEILQSQIYYDKAGDEHYDTISAFIKSIRGSDPDAALHYLARMIKAGEDPKFIARRLIILASEDIGNADPEALTLAVSCARAVEFVGLPEAAINLAQATTYLACAPKSNASYLGLIRAQEDLENKIPDPIPLHLRNAPTNLMKTLDFGKDYIYAHSEKDGIAKLEYLPDNLKGREYYKPTDRGKDKEIGERLEEIKKKRKGKVWKTGSE